MSIQAPPPPKPPKPQYDPDFLEEAVRLWNLAIRRHVQAGQENAPEEWFLGSTTATEIHSLKQPEQHGPRLWCLSVRSWKLARPSARPAQSKRWPRKRFSGLSSTLKLQLPLVRGVNDVGAIDLPQSGRQAQQDVGFPGGGGTLKMFRGCQLRGYG